MEAIYFGQIIAWAGQWVPEGWAACNGQQLSINQYQALYSLIGSLYGGDNKTYFNLPNLNGAVPVGAGVPQPPLQKQYVLAKAGGEANHQLALSELPTHTHNGALTGAGINLQVQVSQNAATQSAPTASLVPAAGASPGTSTGDTVVVNLYANAGPNTTMSGMVCTVNVKATNVTVGNTGGGAAHNNMMPYLPMYYIISLTQGIYPPFN